MIPLTKLYERTSRSGNRHLSGRLGDVNILVFPDREPTEDGTKTYSVKVAERQPNNRNSSNNNTNTDTSGVNDLLAPLAEETPS